MSDKFNIESTEFKSKNGLSTFGVRVYDDYGKTYNNTWEFIPIDNLQILEKTVENADEDMMCFLSGIISNQKGVYIDETWYDWGEIKHILMKENDD